MQDEIKVMVKFTITEGKLSYTDALYYDLAIYPSIPKATIDSAKQSRFDTWKTELAKPHPPLDIDKTIADIQTQIDLLTQQKAAYQQQKQAQGGGAK